MFDLVLIQQCADPRVEIAIVERFIAEAGADDPLAITITSGNRVILPEAPRTPEAAMRLIERFVGQAIVRVGVTRYPAGHGISDASELSPGLVDPCENIRMGTTLFGKVHRIVSHARGATDGIAFTQSLEAWQTGMFEGRYVFGEADPGPLPAAEEIDANELPDADVEDPVPYTVPGETDAQGAGILDPNKAGIRIDLSPIGARRDP